jgi:DNA-directed RNA polymerase subunit M/transcription elongation factor TFIIS
MDLLTNAVESIQLGVEDYRIGTRPRLLSAVRNIHAGILLLYKEALLRRSPLESNEALVKAKLAPIVDKGGKVIFVGVGKRTVDTEQIRERFKTLMITTDWSLLEQIASVRNDIEHYFPRLEQEAIAGVVASAFLIIRKFAADELGEEPRELLGEATWDSMLQVAEVYQAERKECDDALGQIEWESEALEDGIKKLSCSECGSGLLKPVDGCSTYSDVSLECRVCGSTRERDLFIPEALAKALDREAYIVMTEGGEEPCVECPHCGNETYVYAEGRCALCGESAATVCERCGNTIPACEITSSDLCSWCDHMMSKDD